MEVCPTNAIELGPVIEIAKGTISNENPKIIIDNEKCAKCFLCAKVCPNEALEVKIDPTDHIDLSEYPNLEKYYEIDEEKCEYEQDNPICNLCIKIRDKNKLKDFVKISKECPCKCFNVVSPFENEVILLRQQFFKCSPENCGYCVDFCPTEALFYPKTAEEVKKFEKIGINQEKCVGCSSCVALCPEDLIIVDRKDVKIIEPKTTKNPPWIKAWIKQIKKLLQTRLIGQKGKQQIEIPIIEEEVKQVKKKIEETIPQLSKEDKIKLNELNEKIQTFLKSAKIRYWIKDKKVDKIIKELNLFLDKNKN